LQRQIQREKEVGKLAVEVPGPVSPRLDIAEALGDVPVEGMQRNRNTVANNVAALFEVPCADCHLQKSGQDLTFCHAFRPNRSLGKNSNDLRAVLL